MRNEAIHRISAQGLGLLLACGTCASTIAEVTLDGSLGPRGLLPAPDGHYQIFQEYGQTVGSNLFHSFGKFNLELGTAATFYGAPSIDNIVGRVTGGTASSIDGLLTSAIPGANLWLINPAGVVFGPHASVNVDGSFYVSTAHYLKFSDGLKFETTAAITPVLTSAAPEAFGFLAPPAPIEFQGSGSTAARNLASGYYAGRLDLQWNDMKVPEGKTFAVVGGDVFVHDGSLATGETVATKLQAPSGRVAIASVASEGELNPNAEDVDADSFEHQGSVAIGSTLAPGEAAIDTSGDGGGEIVIRGGQLVMENAALVSETRGTTDGKRIDVEVSGDIIMNANGTGLYASTRGTGKGADIAVSAGGGLTMRNGARIGSATIGAGQGGTVNVSGGSFVAIDSASAIVTSTGGTGAGGSVKVQAPLISVTNRAGLQSATVDEGRGGDISLDAEDVAISSGAMVLTVARGSGSGGSLDVHAENLLYGDGAVQIRSATRGGQSGSVSIKARDIALSNEATIMSTSDGPSDAGDIDVRAGTLALGSGAQITSGTEGSGGSGDLTVAAQDLITLSGHSETLPSGIFNNSLGSGNVGATSVTSKVIDVSDFAQIGGSTKGAGNASDITVSAEFLAISTGGRIESTSTATGSAGAINLDVNGALSIRDGGMVVSNAFGAGDGGDISIVSPAVLFRNGLVEAASDDQGNSGSISIDSGELSILDGSLVNTSTAGGGDGGRIELSVKTIALARSDVRSSTELSGNAGTIHISAETFESINGKVESETFGNGAGGTIDLRVGDLTLSDGAQISASTAGAGNGGDVRISPSGSIRLIATDDVFTSIRSTALSGGKAGNVAVETRQLMIDGPATIEASTVGTGDGGKVEIVSDQIRLRNGGQIGSSTGLTASGLPVIAGEGDAGTVSVVARQNLTAAGTSGDGFQSSGIFAQGSGSGKGGDIKVIAPVLELTNKGQISVSTAGDNDAGSVDIHTNRLVLNEGASITSGSGIRLADGRTVIGSGSGGDIAVTADDALILTDDGTSVSTTTLGSGDGGNITIRAGQFTLNSESTIASSSAGTGLAGNIDIDAGQNFHSNDGRITAEAKESDGGNISVKATDRIHLVDSAITTSVGSGQGKGGNIFIDPRFVILDNSQITAQAFGGPGGNIRIIADNFIRSPESLVSASSRFGVDGTVVIDSPDTNIVGKTAALKTPFIDAAALFKQQCAARYAGGGQSTLVVNSARAVTSAPGDGFYSTGYESVSRETPRLAVLHPEAVVDQNELSGKCETQ